MSDKTGQGVDGRDQQLDEAAGDRSSGKAGNLTVSCNGSAAGDASKYMFENPQELAGIIAKWVNEDHSMGVDRSQFQWAAGKAEAPAPDAISVGYFNALVSVLQQFIEHNEAMGKYTATYVSKLRASHKDNGQLDQSNAGRLRNIGVK